MADFLAAKRASEVVERRWNAGDDTPLTVSTSASGVTVDSSAIEGQEIVLTLSGGTAAATGSVVVTVTTSLGQTLIETLYIPIVESAAQIADTAREYAYFALRKVFGLGNTPDAAALDDALERLSAMVATWREAGADIGAPFPLDANSVIYCPDYAVAALRYNLAVACAEFYGLPPSSHDYEMARRGLQLVKHRNLPQPDAVEYF